MKHDDVIKKASEISNFLQDLSKELYEKDPDRIRKLDIPYDDFQYAEALLLWEQDGTDTDYFSTKDEFMLEFRKELQEKFGLEIVSREEGLRRKNEIILVTGMPTQTKLMN